MIIDSLEIPKLFACCIPVRGYTQALICDLQRQIIQPIPNNLFEILTKHEGKSIEKILSFYDNRFDEIIKEYFTFLADKEYIFFTYFPESFPKINLVWKSPMSLTNAIIDLDFMSSSLDYNSIFNQLEELGCEHVQIRSFSNKSLSYFSTILNIIKFKAIISVELIIKYQKDFTNDVLINFCKMYPRIYTLNLHSAPDTKVVHISDDGMGHVFWTKDILDSSLHCGINSTKLFILNINNFTENQHHNSCLNRKISIDINGNIKNCPSMPQSYGNIKDTTLEEALNHPGFKKHWNITKDKIHVCKDCEFRYICTDCRAYVEDPDDIYSKPLKCGYNPYTGEWEEWSTNPLKQKAIQYYGMEELIKK